MKHIFSITLLVLLNIGFTMAGAHKTEYSIKVKVNGIESDTAAYLAYYYGNSQYLKDTAKVDKSGSFVFDGTEKLPGGIYLVVLQDKSYFEILVNKEQTFSVETNKNDLIENMKIKGSPENTVFYDYLRYIAERGKKAENLSKKIEQLKDNKAKKDSVDLLRKQLTKIDEEVTSYREKTIAANPQTFVATLFKAMGDPKIPDTPKLANGRTDSTFAFRYYKAHYFDNIDFSDDRLLRTPVLHGKIKRYYEQLTAQHPDSIIKASDYIIGKAKANKEVFKYCVWYTSNTYETSKIMGMDAVFVHVAEKYYMSGQAYWIDSTTKAKIAERAMILKPLLLGKKAPKLDLQDSLNRTISLYNVKANYTIVYFWDPNCGHCQKETPKLYEEYKKTLKAKGVEVYAVCVERDVKKWKEFVRKNDMQWINVHDAYHYTDFRNLYDIYSYPVIYVLNSKKEIMAKRIGTEDVGGFIDMLSKAAKK